jgi:hypothetical protein
LESNSEER